MFHSWAAFLSDSKILWTPSLVQNINDLLVVGFLTVISDRSTSFNFFLFYFQRCQISSLANSAIYFCQANSSTFFLFSRLYLSLHCGDVVISMPWLAIWVALGYLVLVSQSFCPATFRCISYTTSARITWDPQIRHFFLIQLRFIPKKSL